VEVLFGSEVKRVGRAGLTCKQWYTVHMHNTKHLHHVITANEASKIWGLSRNAITQACRAGKMPARKSGQTWLVTIADMLRYKGGAYVPSLIPEDIKPTFLQVAEQVRGELSGQ